MGAGAELDFTELLDDLIAASQAKEEELVSARPAPSLQVDMLDQIERLQAENVALFSSRATEAYGEHAGRVIREAADAAAARLQPALDDLFFLDPETISRELGIAAKSRPEDLDKARRAFAMRYHPDRVPEEFRDRAALRMQIANMLIDQAKGRRR